MRHSFTSWLGTSSPISTFLGHNGKRKSHGEKALHYYAITSGARTDANESGPAFLVSATQRVGFSNIGRILQSGVDSPIRGMGSAQTRKTRDQLTGKEARGRVQDEQRNSTAVTIIMLLQVLRLTVASVFLLSSTLSGRSTSILCRR